jgi:hypothetical protein
VVAEEGAKERSGRRSPRSGDSRRSAEEEFLDSLSKEARMSSQAGSVPSSYDSPRSQTPKASVSGESGSPVKGSFMRGFGRSRTRRSSGQLSPRTGESQLEGSAGDGSNGLMGSSRLSMESSHRATSGASSGSMDGSEAESVGMVDSGGGFTIPASNGSAFPDLNEPYVPPSMDLPQRRLSELKVSVPEADDVEAVVDSSERVPQSPKTPAPGSAKAKDSPSSGVGPFGVEARSRGVSSEEGVAMRRAFDLNSTESPTASPSFAQRSRRSTRGDASRSNGSSSNIDEPLTKFEVNLATGAASGGSRRGRRRSDPVVEVWLTVDQIRLVTKPCRYPPPSRPPPPPPPLARQHGDGERHRSSQRSGGPGTPKHEGSLRSQFLEADKQQQQQWSPRSEPSGADRLRASQKVQARADVERQQQQHGIGGGKQQGVGNERANGGGVQKHGEKQRGGFVLPEVTVVEIGAEIHQKPSREEKEKMRAQMDRAARRAKREEERAREKERIQREGLSASIFHEAEAREPSRSRAGRDKVFYPKERHSQDPATRRDEDIQYRVQRQQAKELQERLARREEARDRENERSGDRLRRSAEKAALEAQERAERAAVERAVQEAHERAERAARQRAAAAREKERVKERERERERERDREEEKLRDRLREKERGLAEQLRSRESFRATSEPRQRPSVGAGNPASGLSRFSSGGSLNKFAGTAPEATGKSPSREQKASDDWTSLYTQGASGTEKFQEIPGEPADRRKLRLEKQMLIEERAAKALQEKNMRDQALQREQEERQRFASSLDADVRRWSVGKEGNLRALLSTLHVMLWAECNWKVVSMSDLVSGPSVKKAYQRAILCVHPDKVQQKGANVKQKYIAEKVFDLLKDAYAKFNSEQY